MRSTETVRVELQIGAVRYVDVETAEQLGSTGNFRECEPEGVVRVLRALPPPGWVRPVADRLYVPVVEGEWREIEEDVGRDGSAVVLTEDRGSQRQETENVRESEERAQEGDGSGRR